MEKRRTSIVRQIRLVSGIFLALWMVLAPLAGTRAGAAAPAGLEVRVMSFNIRYGTASDGENRWQNRREIVCDLLRSAECDVVGLQEALAFQIDRIGKVLPKYGQVGVGRDDGRTKGEYCPILYRQDRFMLDESGTFWLSDTPDVPGSSHWGNACVRICTWVRLVEKKSGSACYIFNIHLDHVSQPSREKSVALLAKRIRDRRCPDPFVVMGDFNAGEQNPAVMYLKGRTKLDHVAEGLSRSPVTMVDTFRVLHPEAADVGTFNGFKGDRTGEKIDYVLAPPEVTVLEAKIVRDDSDGRYPSDHFPVVALLRMPRPQPR
ncbi:MAG: endonuclease/exonuclease/phosphatase family protein [Phycisphaerales bacterium]|nr:MAG: endonuclease/exonuclease/phosphatase family protein [Phycisphaerales bacterium]